MNSKISEKNWKNLALNLDELCIFLDNVYQINNGGCCYIAYCIAKLLEQDNIPFDLIIYNCSIETFEELDCSQYHYAISLDDIIINNFDDGDYVIMSNVSADNLYKHYKECSWNNIYNKSKNTFLLRIIKAFYNDFKKDLL